MTKMEIKVIERLNQILMRYRKCTSLVELVDIRNELKGYVMFNPNNIIAISELKDVNEKILNWKE